MNMRVKKTYVKYLVNLLNQLCIALYLLLEIVIDINISK